MTGSGRFGWVLAVGVLLALSIATAPAHSAVKTIEMGSFFYEDNAPPPDEIHAEVGDQLTFVAVDNGKGTPHTVEIDALGIHSGNLATGKTFTTGALTSPGSYYVYCKPHENKGHFTTLVVDGTAATTTTTPTTAAPTTTTTTTTTTPTSTTEVPDSTTTTTIAAQIATTTTAPIQGVLPDTPEQTSETLAPTGVGSIDLDAVGIAAPLSPLERALGEPNRDQAPWTRSVWFGLFALVPVAAIAIAAALRHRQRTAGFRR